MKFTENIFVMALLNDISTFLRDPVIKIQNSDDVMDLQRQVQDLQREYDALKLKYDQLLSVYQDEMQFCFRLQDLCRNNGIKWR